MENMDIQFLISNNLRRKDRAERNILNSQAELEQVEKTLARLEELDKQESYTLDEINWLLQVNYNGY